MEKPKKVNLMTSDEVRAGGWMAEVRDDNGHLLSMIAPSCSDATLGEWLRECSEIPEAGDVHITVFRKAG